MAYTKHDFKRRKLIGAIFGNLEVIPFNPELDPKPFSCYNCWSDEHFRRDCPEPVKRTYCRNCGRRDVEIQDCPRCAKAHCKFLSEWERNEKEQRRLSAALYNSKQFSAEEDFRLVTSTRRKGIKRKHEMDTKTCHDIEVKSSLGKTLTSDTNMFCVDECCCYYSEDEESIVIENFEDESQSERFESVQGDFVAWSEIIKTAEDCEDEFCSDTDDSDYESTRAAFIRDCDSDCSDDFDQECSDSSSFHDGNNQEFSDSICDSRDAQLNELFTYIRNKKSQDKFTNNNIILKNCSKTPAKITTVYYSNEIEEDVDYDDMIVDENERSESLCSGDHGIQEFLDLLDAVKHLPIEVQNIAVLHFVSERKKQCYQNQKKFCDIEFA